MIQIISLSTVALTILFVSSVAPASTPEDDVFLISDDIPEPKPFKFFILSEDGSVDEFVIDVVNASILATNSLIELHHVMISIDITVEDLCNSMGGGGHFVLSTVHNHALQNVVRRVSAISHIPIIQIDYSVWSYEHIIVADFNSSVNYTEEAAQTVMDVGGSTNSLVESAIQMALSQGPTKDDEEVDVEANYIRVVKPTAVLLNVLLELRANKGNMSRSLHVLYDQAYDKMDILWQEILGQSEFDIHFEPMEYCNRSVNRAQLEDLTTRKPSVENILLLASSQNAAVFIAEAYNEHKQGIFDWTVLTRDTRPFECDECSDVDTTYISPEDGENFRLHRNFKDYLRSRADLANLISSDQELDASFYHDLIYIAWNYVLHLNNTAQLENVFGCNLNKSTSRLLNETVLRLKDVFDAAPEGGFGPYLRDTSQNKLYFQNILTRIVDVNYKSLDYTERRIIMKEVGNWTVVTGLLTQYDSLKPDFSNMQHYKVVTLEGYCIDVFEELARMYDFTYDIYEVKDKEHGFLNADGEWNGLIADLLAGKAEIAVAPVIVTAERQEAVEFTIPYANLVGIRILMKKDDVQTDLFKFITVMEGQVWLVLIAAFMFASVVLFMVEKLSPYSYSNNKDVYGHNHQKFTLKECFWFALTSLTPQGGGEPPKNISGRIIAATWWLFGFLVIATYTANLAALLTASRLVGAVKSLGDLTEQYKIQYAPVQESVASSYFRIMAEIEENILDNWLKQSKDTNSVPDKKTKKIRSGLEDFPVSDFYQTLWGNMKKFGLPATTQEAIDRVLSSPSASEGFAFIGDSSIVRYAAMTNCKLQEVGDEISRKPYSFPVQAGSPLKDLLTSGILRLTNNRILDELRVKWWDHNPKDAQCPEVTSVQESITIQNVGGVFILVLIGSGLATMTLSAEVWMMTQRKVKKSISNGLKMALNNENNNHRITQGTLYNPMNPPSFLFNLASIARRQIEDEQIEEELRNKTQIEQEEIDKRMQVRMGNGTFGSTRVRPLNNGDRNFDLVD